MTKSTSKIPIMTRSTGPKRAHFDDHRVQTVHIERDSLPHLSFEKVVEVAKLDTEKKAKPTDQGVHDPFHDEACSCCVPPPSSVEKKRVPTEWVHMPWDEIELKKHSLLDRKCHHYGTTPLPDEVELKKLGLVDSECHHRPLPLDEKQKREAAQIGIKAHQKLEYVCKINRGKLECKAKEPHIKISRAVEVVDDKTCMKMDDDESSTVMLTARPSKTSSSGQSRPLSKERLSVSRSPSPKAPRMPAIVSSTPKVHEAAQPIRIQANAEPIVLTKTFETADGEVQFNLSFEVRFKPKDNASGVSQDS